MENTYGFNSRKFNSASSMSGCIEREMSKIILALPTDDDDTGSRRNPLVPRGCVSTQYNHHVVQQR